MKDYLIEVLAVVAISPRTQWLILLGPVFFIGISLLGAHLTDGFELQTAGGEPFSEVIRHKILKHYQKAALGVLITSWIAAFKCYQKDKDKLW